MSEQTPGERLANFRKFKGFPLREMAEPLGLSLQSVSRWEKSESPIPKMGAQALEKAFGVSADWLLTGEGEMMLPVQKVEDEHSNVKVVPFSDYVLIPFLSARPCASSGNLLEDYVGELGALPYSKTWLRKFVGVSPQHLCLLEIEGDCMAPTFYHEDLLLVDSSAPEKPYRDGVWVLKIGDSLHVKRVQRLKENHFQARQDNPVYGGPVDLDETSQLMGRVVGSIKKNA